jgi:hypothetical protein
MGLRKLEKRQSVIFRFFGSSRAIVPRPTSIFEWHRDNDGASKKLLAYAIYILEDSYKPTPRDGPSELRCKDFESLGFKEE